ncbi:MAG: prepilin-type N-terminal cleavage/methylation domain-containing protein [Candidatus Omnitrophica bacterium]|nr:prepilin-type N-terminal cleavage/methylation domain-containing protein [Candidatus Omnitrophota bacterium]
MKNFRGFTIIEVLVSALVMSLLIFAAFAVLDVGRGSWFGGDVRTELRKEMIRAFMSMERELRETRPVSGGPSARINLNFGETGNSISFQIPQDNDLDGTVLDSLGDIEWSGNITYLLNENNEIIRTAADGTSKVLALNITGLEFSRFRIPDLPNDLLIINLTAQKMSGIGKLATERGQLIVRMRN